MPTTVVRAAMALARALGLSRPSAEAPTRVWLEAENAVLRHQLIVLRRRLHGRVRLTNQDRWFLIRLYRWFPSILQVLTIIRPETLVRLASGQFSLLLALEITSTGRATADRYGAARADPADE